jgi:hypothetical protein
MKLPKRTPRKRKRKRQNNPKTSESGLTYKLLLN